MTHGIQGRTWQYTSPVIAGMPAPLSPWNSSEAVTLTGSRRTMAVPINSSTRTFLSFSCRVQQRGFRDSWGRGQLMTRGHVMQGVHAFSSVTVIVRVSLGWTEKNWNISFQTGLRPPSAEGTVRHEHDCVRTCAAGVHHLGRGSGLPRGAQHSTAQADSTHRCKFLISACWVQAVGWHMDPDDL